MDLKRKAAEVDRRLADAFHGTLPPPRGDLVLELVHAVLSQNTSRSNYNRAYDALLERYPTPERMAKAPLAGIEEAIRPGGLSRQKSSAIKAILAAIEGDRGELSLEFLRGMKVDEARRYMTALPGVGPKTASVVLMFAAGKKVLPVDTHVLRVSRRVGLIDRGSSAEKAEPALEGIVPPASRPRVHLNMVRLGREVCRARDPRCEACPLSPVCDYYRSSSPAAGPRK